MNRQIIKNIIFNGISFVTNMVLTLILTPYLVKSLGVIAYGFIPLAMIFTAYIGIITESLTISINRNITAAIQSNEIDEANGIFTTALLTIFVVICISSLLLIYPVINISHIIDIPSNLITEVRYLFSLFAIAFFISLLTSVLSVSMYSLNRLDLMQVNGIIRNVVKFVSIYIFFYLENKNIINVGYSVVIASFTSLIFCWVCNKKLASNLKFNIRLFKPEKIKPLINMGGWLLVNQLGFVLFMKVDLLIINKWIGPESSGLYSIALQFNDVLRTFAGIISGVLGPAILILYAKGKLDELIKLSNGFVKFLSIMISIPIILICIFSEEILKYWMGANFIKLSLLVWIITLPLVINIGVQPLFAIQVALNKVKLPALMNLIFGSVGIVSSILLIKYSNLGYYSVAISSVVMLTLKNAIFTPIYTAMILNINKHKFINVHFKTVFFTFCSLIISKIIYEVVDIQSLIKLLLVMLFCSILLLLFSILFFSKQEKNSFISFIKEKV